MDRRPKNDWFERHAGLGGWVGTIGTIAAIFAAWWLARAEYLRTQRLEDARMNTEISLISRTAKEFDPIVQKYIQLLNDHSAQVFGYYNHQKNDGRWLRMDDFNALPITQWPSVESYDAFKRYFVASIELMKPRISTTLSNEQGETQIERDKKEQIKAYDGTLQKLQHALEAARR